LFLRENVDGLLAAFSKLIDDLSFDKLYLMDWDDVSWLTEETQLLPALVPVIEKVILNAGGRLKAKQLQVFLDDMSIGNLLFSMSI